MSTTTSITTSTTPSPSTAAHTVDLTSFWLSYTVIFLISSFEAFFSLLWTRLRVTSNPHSPHPPELSRRVFGRELLVSTLTPQAARRLAVKGRLPMFPWKLHSSEPDGYEKSFSHEKKGFSLNGGFFRVRAEVEGDEVDATIDNWLDHGQIAPLVVRRFNPMASLKAPAGLVDNGRKLLGYGEYDGESTRGRVVHVLVGVADIGLGIVGLALDTSQVTGLFETLKDPAAPMTFQSYLVLFLLCQLLGAVLLVCMATVGERRRSLQLFGWPGMVAFGVAVVIHLGMFGLGCGR